MARQSRAPGQPAPTTPIAHVSQNTLRKQVEDALYECGVITDIINRLATLMIISRGEVCGTAFDMLARQLLARHETIREAIRQDSFGREA